MVASMVASRFFHMHRATRGEPERSSACASVRVWYIMNDINDRMFNCRRFRSWHTSEKLQYFLPEYLRERSCGIWTRWILKTKHCSSIVHYRKGLRQHFSQKSRKTKKQGNHVSTDICICIYICTCINRKQSDPLDVSRFRRIFL